MRQQPCRINGEMVVDVVADVSGDVGAKTTMVSGFIGLLIVQG